MSANIVKIQGIEYKVDELHFVEGIVEIPSCDMEFDYLEEYARIWLDKFGNPVIAEPFAPYGVHEFDRRYYNREVDFVVIDVFDLNKHFKKIFGGN